MAEGTSNTGSEGDTWENWFGGWMQTAKEKSQTALEFVKKDLAEFGTTVQKETEKAVEITKGSLHSESTTEATKKVKAGLASFLDNISKVLVIPHDDDADVPMKVAADGSGLYDRGKARLHALQLDASTYIDPARGSPEQYSMWLESFNLEEHKGEISELLVSKVEVRALYTKLVPSEVSNADFWQRYFYRVHQLQCDEARKQALMMRADQTGGKESVCWDDDDDEEFCDKEDDGENSDWEKMPRPPQSYLSQQKSEPQEEEPKSVSVVHSSDSNSPHIPEQQQASQNSSTHAASKAEETEALGSEADNVSAQAAEPSLKTSPPVALGESQNVDASGESAEWSPVETVSNPWSLHIPQDLASASDAVEEKTVQHDGSNEGSAAGAEAIPQAHPTVSPTADGACGAAESEPVVEETTVQSPKRPDQSKEVSTAGLADASDSQEIESPTHQEAIADAAEAQLSKELSRPQVFSPATEVSNKSEEVEQTEKDHTVESEQALLTNRAKTDFIPVSEEVKDSVVAEGGENGATQSSESKTETDATSAQAANDKEIGMRVKGDMVVVGDRDSPSSTESTDTKDLGLEDWEQFDVEITEEDLKAAEDIAKRLGENLDDNDDDWENWE